MYESLSSRPYRPDPAYCCERCTFGTGPHLKGCENEAEYSALERSFRRGTAERARLLELTGITRHSVNRDHDLISGAGARR